MNKIEVMDSRGKPLKSTYDKRAKQLVKAKRAQWVDMDKIMLLTVESCEEVSDLTDGGYEHTTNDNSYGPMGYIPVPDLPYSLGYSDEELFKLAKKRVNERKSFMIHFASYVLVNLFMLLLSIMESEPIVFFTAGGWGIGLGVHAVSYFVNSGPEAIHREFQKLKSGDFRRSLRG